MRTAMASCKHRFGIGRLPSGLLYITVAAVVVSAADKAFADGACCVPGEGCAQTDETTCTTDLFGVYMGDGTACPEQNLVVVIEPGGAIVVHVVGPAVDCAPPGSGSCTPGEPKIDAWRTPSDPPTCHNFGAVGAGPIPADFFGPGSDPFDGGVCLVGEPLGPTPWGDFGNADTLIERSADPFDRCSLPTETPQVVDIEIVALSLVGTSPITVTYFGGMESDDWDVTVDLSTVTPPAGSLTARKTHCNGGTYTSVLNVCPRFLFTRIGDGQQVVFDTCALGLDHVILDQSNPYPWVHDLEPFLFAAVDQCSDFHAGIRGKDPIFDCDCQPNDIRDKCDIEEGSPDSNHNGIPDECEGIDACCLPDGTCANPADCEAVGGAPQGAGSFCTVSEACCFPDDTCAMVDPLCCDDLGGTAGGPGSTCGGMQACCAGDGSCYMADRTCCLANGDSPKGAGSVCLGDGNDNDIDDACETGACCVPNEGCAQTDQATCIALFGEYMGHLTACPEQNLVVVVEPGGAIVVHVVGPAVDCAPPGSGSCPPGEPKIDAWRTPSDPPTCHDFGAVGAGPIPADFFGPGSDPFDGGVCLAGVPLGSTAWGDFGNADTLVERSADPFDRCSLPTETPQVVDIEIVALSLVGTSPITVTYFGGMESDDWDVTVGLSIVTPPAGSLTATKTHCNGGMYTSQLNVCPRFLFTRIGDGQQVVLDTCALGLDHIILVQSDPAPWVHDLEPFLFAAVDQCSDFHAGIRDKDPIIDCDCQPNDVRDKCDIEEGSPDNNGNGVPDECEIPEPPQTPPVDPWGSRVDKNRYISMVIPTSVVASNEETAIRVTLTSLHHPDAPEIVPNFSDWEGNYRWVNSLSGTHICPDSPNFLDTTFRCAVLGCDPEYRAWSKELGGETLHVTGAAVVPSSDYEVALLAASCAGIEASCAAVSEELSITTAKFGDVDPLTDGLVVLDIARVVDHVKGKPYPTTWPPELGTALFKPRVHLRPNVPNALGENVGVLDIATAVDAVKGNAYWHFGAFGPCTDACPGEAPCP